MVFTLLITDLECHEYEVRDESELERVLMSRYGGGFNHFALFVGRDEYPSLIIMVNEELAWLYFLIGSEHPGYHAVGSVGGLDPSEGTRFVSVGPQKELFTNQQVVPFVDALRAAKEFFAMGRLPRCIEWREPTFD